MSIMNHGDLTGQFMYWLNGCDGKTGWQRGDKDSIRDADTLSPLNERGDRLRDQLTEALTPVGFCVTGAGSMMTIHPVPGPWKLLIVWTFPVLTGLFMSPVIRPPLPGMLPPSPNQDTFPR